MSPSAKRGPKVTWTVHPESLVFNEWHECELGRIAKFSDGWTASIWIKKDGVPGGTVLMSVGANYKSAASARAKVIQRAEIYNKVGS